MKKTLFKIMLLSVISFGAYFTSSAQIYVTVRPVAPVIVQTVRPSPAHVWIGEEWDENGHEYKYSGGHWATPPRATRIKNRAIHIGLMKRGIVQA